MRRCLMTCLGLVAILASGIAMSQVRAMAENTEAAQAYAAGEKKQAFELWKHDAEAGDAQAQLLVANMLATGDGVSQSFEIANIYYAMAADQGRLEALVQLATNYRVGQGVEVDLSQAEELLKKAASAGHPVAQFDLAEIYLEDLQNVENSGSLAAAWYEAAAVQGVVMAQVKLADLTMKGLERDGVLQVPQDPPWAFTWLEIAKRGADGSLQEAPVSRRVFALDDMLENEGKTFRQYVLDQYALVSSVLPENIVAEVRASIDQQLAGSAPTASE
ncbi:MAG: sel1 repeat family protein [Alphaproteobacteria bacterium]|nr:MAG: sel1 repeat family protein [Alphaproteobacteria bacterium]